MIERVRILGFRCLAELALPISPLTVIHGPPDSGKSSVLDAIAFAMQTWRRPLLPVPEDAAPICASVEELATHLRAGELELEIEGWLDVHRFRYRLALSTRLVRDGPTDETLHVDDEPVLEAGPIGLPSTGLRSMIARHREYAWLMRALDARGPLRWAPRRLASPSPISMDEGWQHDGFGLPTAVDQVRDRSSPEQWSAIEAAFRRLSPFAGSLRLMTQPRIRALKGHEPGKQLKFAVPDAPLLVPSSHVADSVLATLAYTMLAHLHGRPALVLVDDFDALLDDAQVEAVLGILRGIAVSSPDTCVIATARRRASLNALEAREIVELSRDGSGTHAALRTARVVQP
jgi:hypothetical protein